MPLEAVYTERFLRDMDEKLDSELRCKAETICERLQRDPAHAAHSRRLKHQLSSYRAADIPPKRRGRWRIIFGIHGEHPDVPEGRIVFFFVSEHYR